MKLVFMGTPDFAATALRALHAAGHEIVAVYAQPARPAGRGMAARPSPVEALARSLGLDVRTPLSLKGEEAARFAALDADAAVVAAYGLLLPPDVLAAPRLGCLNIHASLLPRWRGAAPIQRAIMAGDHETGITIMQMDEGLDTGAMLASARIPIWGSDTAATLHDGLAGLGAELIVKTLVDVDAGRVRAVPQPAEGVTYAKKITKAEARIDFARPARDLRNHIHGLSPFPGAWFEWGGHRIKVLAAVVEDGRGAPGTALDDRLLIACGEGALRLLTLQREGKSAMPAEAFLRGLPVPEGSRAQ